MDRARDWRRAPRSRTAATAVAALREHLLNRRRAQEPVTPGLQGGKVGGGEADPGARVRMRAAHAEDRVHAGLLIGRRISRQRLEESS